MSFRRLVGILILVLAILPWGAYSGALASQNKGDRIAAALFADDNVSHEVARGGDERGLAIVSAPKKRCRTGILVGSACGLDAAIVGPTTSIDPSGACNSHLSAGSMLLAGQPPKGILDPPRSC